MFTRGDTVAVSLHQLVPTLCVGMKRLDAPRPVTPADSDCKCEHPMGATLGRRAWEREKHPTREIENTLSALEHICHINRRCKLAIVTIKDTLVGFVITNFRPDEERFPDFNVCGKGEFPDIKIVNATPGAIRIIEVFAPERQANNVRDVTADDAGKSPPFAITAVYCDAIFRAIIEIEVECGLFKRPGCQNNIPEMAVVAAIIRLFRSVAAIYDKMSIR